MSTGIPHGTILIVDDELFYRKILTDILKEEGFVEIVEAVDGIDAVEKFLRYRPRLSIIDIYMPEQNGLETAKKIFSIDKDAGILMCSGSEYDDDVQAAMKTGVLGVIQKPIIAEELIGFVNKAMGK